MSRFLERLAEEPPLVADGGMGALLSSAVPGLRCPEEANLVVIPGIGFHFVVGPEVGLQSLLLLMFVFVSQAEA